MFAPQGPLTPSYFGGGYIYYGMIGTSASSLATSQAGFALGYIGMGVVGWQDPYAGRGFVPNYIGPIGHFVTCGTIELPFLMIS